MSKFQSVIREKARVALEKISATREKARAAFVRILEQTKKTSGFGQGVKPVFGKIPEQIRRLAVVIAIIVIAVIVARYYLIPPSLLDMRFHREATIKKEISKGIKFAGISACSNCHGQSIQTKNKGFHKNLSCETCHGPAMKHATDPLTVKPFVPRKREYCAQCHTFNPSRPTGFPQISPTLHNPVKPCVTCHNPHDPKPPTTPQECSACHGEIARMKAVSHHALVACRDCHAAPEIHKLTPRVVTPTKPATREFCGKCHGQEAERKDTPKIDLATHGERYLCWQCHYPHQPGKV
jgi:hypothetical protein